MDDYISREAAREDACDRCGKQGHCNRPEFCPVIYSVNTIPSADVVARDCYNRILKENDTMREQLAQIGKKPGDSMDDVKREKRGKWVYNEDDNIPYCSECMMPQDMPVDYCPSCGADMREDNT